MKSIRTPQQDIEAMDIIISIQAMQTKLYGQAFEYNDFNSNTVDELRSLRDSLMSKYNKTFDQC